MKQKIKQYDVFILQNDINPTIIKGMTGVVLEVWDDNSYEVEFVKPDGTNYGFNDQFTFTVNRSHIDKIN